MELRNALSDLRPRIIVCLLMKDGRLVKTKSFRDPTYVGDPLNAVRVFNEKVVDELMVLDIGASLDGYPPRLDVIERLSRECQMPFAYGGGVSSVEDFEQLTSLGVEKVVISHAAVTNPSLISHAAETVGSQSVVVSIDISKRLDSTNEYEVTTLSNTLRTSLKPADFAQRAQQLGAGEILLSNVDRDGRRIGLDLDIASEVFRSTQVPMTLVGGVGGVADVAAAVKALGTVGVGAGSIFVFHGRFDAVLLKYISTDERRLIELR